MRHSALLLALFGTLAACVSSLPPIGEPPAATPAPIPSSPPPPPPPEVASVVAPPGVSARPQPRSREDREAAVLGLLSGAVPLSQLPVEGEKNNPARSPASASIYQSAIQSRRDALSATCWKPAQQAALHRGQGILPSVQLRATLRLLPDGRVDEGEVTGGHAYPGLSDCVLHALRSIAYQPPGARQTVTTDLTLR